MKISRPEGRRTLEGERERRRRGVLDRLDACDRELQAGLPGRREVSGSPRSAVSASTSGGRGCGAPRCRIFSTGSLMSGSPERCRRRSKNVGTARSIASPPEIPSQVTLIAPTRP